MLASLAMALITGCDTSPAPPPALAPTAAVASPTAEVTTLENGVRLDPTVSGKIELWHFWASPVRRNAIRRVMAVCNDKLPNIVVSDTIKPFGDIWNQNIAAVEQGSGMPDVIVEDRPKIAERARNNIDQSLQEWATRDGIDGTQFWPFTWQQSNYENETYGIPYETEVRVLFYNRSLFKDAGLDQAKPPATWDELWQAADKIDQKNPDGTYSRIAFYPLIGNASAQLWGYTNGADWIDAQGQPVLTDTKAIETMTWMKKWVDRYGGFDAMKQFLSQFGTGPNDPFMSGKVAMFVDINGYASQLNFFRPKYESKGEGSINLDWGVSDIPYGEQKASWSGGFAPSIPRGAKNPQAAWEFIKCATAPEAQASWARDTYSMPANREAASDPILLADPSWQLFVDAMSYTRAGNTPTYSAWNSELEKRAEDVWTGKVSPEEALQQAQQAILEAMAADK
jgi:multiple sugar transport system substrate-binding protein